MTPPRDTFGPSVQVEETTGTRTTYLEGKRIHILVIQIQIARATYTNDLSTVSVPDISIGFFGLQRRVIKDTIGPLSLCL